MNTISLDHIWVKDLRHTKTKSGIELLTPEDERIATKTEYCFVEITNIGITVPKEELGNEKDGFLEVGDRAIVDINLPGMRQAKLKLDGEEHCLIKIHNIIGFEKGKK